MRLSLDKCLAHSALNREEVNALISRMWQQNGIAVLPVDTIDDDWVKCVILNQATKMYGPRLKTKESVATEFAERTR